MKTTVAEINFNFSLADYKINLKFADMNTKNMREYHKIMFERMGLDTSKCYETCVEELIKRYVALSKEANETEKERFARELYNLKTYRTN